MSIEFGFGFFPCARRESKIVNYSTRFRPMKFHSERKNNIHLFFFTSKGSFRSRKKNCKGFISWCHSVGELQCGEVAVWESCGVGELLCGGVAV